jgi:glycosyltransferase involved in cell wall biosynthesis
MKKKILFATTSPVTLQAFVLPLVEDLQDSNYEIELLCGQGELELDSKLLTSNLHQVKLGRNISILEDFKSIPQCLTIIRRIKPDIIIASTPKISPIVILSAWLLRVPIRIFQIRGARWEGLSGWRRTLVQLADRMASAFSTDMLAVSKSLSELFEKSGISSKSVTVLGKGASKGVDLEIFTGMDPNFDSNLRVIGFLGRLSIDKGLDQALEAFDQINHEFPDAILEVIGTLDHTQPIQSSELSRISSDPKIKWLQHVPNSDLPEVVAKWNLLLFPSNREGLPNAVIEVGAMGVPTVGWNVTGVRDAVVNGETGFLLPYGDTKAMALKVSEILRDTDKLNMRRNTQNFVRENFDSDLVSKNFIEYLKSLEGTK